MIPQCIHLGFTGEDLEGSQLEILDAVDVPAIPPVGHDEPVDHRHTLGRRGEEIPYVDTAGDGGLDRRPFFAQCVGRCRANRGVLSAQELFSLDRPGQKLAVENEPTGRELVPEPGPVDSGSYSSEKGRLRGTVGKERSTGAGEDAARRL